ncbi:MAG: hypothetical protein HY075_16710 [Deltaproteobacteria bacterium]|nr:hypothetical protein [Deltaproteobacteria bacterium]
MRHKLKSRKLGQAIFAAALGALALAAPARAQYTIERPGTAVRGQLWAGEGAAGVFSANRSAGHRLRIGADIQFGDDYQFDVGWTFLDRIFSGETSTSVGDVSRRGTDLNLGYFPVPDKLWVMYSLHIEDTSGSSIIGSVTALGHQASVGYRFYSRKALNLAVEAAYLFIGSYDVSTFNYSTNVAGGAKFPAARIWSLNLRIGFDIGGRY